MPVTVHVVVRKQHKQKFIEKNIMGIQQSHRAYSIDGDINSQHTNTLSN